MKTALAWIGKLYAIEKDLRERRKAEWRELPFEEQAAYVAAERQSRSLPLLEGFHTWLETEAPKVLPKSDIRGAMEYTLSNWAALCRYTESGWLDIDNNEGENAIRGIALGRKNWLFCGSDRGGRAAAIHFSLLTSCKRHNLDPWVYFSPACRRFSPVPARKTFSPSFPTAGVPPDRPPMTLRLPRPVPNPRVPPDVYEYRNSLTFRELWPFTKGRCRLALKPHVYVVATNLASEIGQVCRYVGSMKNGEKRAS